MRSSRRARAGAPGALSHVGCIGAATCGLGLALTFGTSAFGAPAPAAAPPSAGDDATAIPADLADCDRRLREAPKETASFYCYTDLVRMAGRDPGPVRARLEGLVATRPDDPRPRMALSQLLNFRDGARARALADEAVALAETDGDAGLVAAARLQSALWLMVRRRVDEATTEFERACDAAERSGAPRTIAGCTVERARFLAFGADDLAHGRALLARLGAQPWYDTLPSRLQAQHLDAAAVIAERLGLTREAYGLTLQLLELASAAGLDKHRAAAQENLVGLAALLDDIDRDTARRHAREAIDWFAAHGMIENELQVRFDLSRWADPDTAWNELRIVEEQSRKHPSCAPLTRLALQSMGERWLDADPPRPEQALASFRAALEAAEADGGLQEIADARVRLALATLRVRPDTLEPAWDALDAVEALADRQVDERWSMELFSGRSPVFYALIDHLILRAQASGSTEPLDAADRVLRRMQARRLHDRLRRAGVRVASGGSGGSGDGKADAGENETAIRTRTSRPDGRTAWIEFAIAPEERLSGRPTGSWAIVATADGRIAHRIDADDLETRVELWRSLIAQRSPDEPGAAARIYADLFGDALDAATDRGIERLVIVPDRFLHAIPFAALRAGADTAPLVERFEIVVAPSVEFWTGRVAAPDIAAHRALLLADPRGDEDPPRIPVAWRDLGEDASSLVALPFARAEVREAERLLGGRAEVRLGPEASEAALKRLAHGEVRLLHLAVHAIVDEDRPERSALILAGSPDQDGLLHPAEIAAMPLAGTCVVLSACRSAGGRTLAGEGPMSLARAFFEAGAPAVVAGLWDLRDEEAAELIRAFYARLAAGATVAEALTGAQREAAVAGLPTAAWSGFVVLGAGDARPWSRSAGRGGRSRTRWVAAGAVLCALALLGFAIRQLSGFSTG